MFYSYINFLLVLPSFIYKSLPFIITGHEGSITFPPDHPGLSAQGQYKSVFCSFCGGVQTGGGEKRVIQKRFHDC